MSKACFLIHGFATTKEDFYSIIPFLKKNYDAIFLDNLPGHGVNSNMSLFTLENTFNYVDTKFDEIKSNYDLVDVYGFSMGGAIATYIASNKEVNRLILFAPANQYFNLKSFGAIIKREIELTFSNDHITREVFHMNNKKSINMMFKYLLPNYSAMSIMTFSRIIKKCNKSLVKNDTRTLLIRGNLDELVPDKASELIKSYFPNIEEKVIPDLGHLMLYSRKYRLIINRVKKFLEEQE